MKIKKDIEELIREYYKPDRHIKESRKDTMVIRTSPMKYCVRESDGQYEQPCPPHEILISFLEGTANKMEKDWVEAHVIECETCHDALTMGRDIIDKYKADKLDEPPTDATVSVSSKLSQYYRKKDK